MRDPGLSVAVLSLALLAGCQPAHPAAQPTSIAPLEEIFWVAWTRDRGIVVSYAPSADRSLARLGAVDHGRLIDLPVPTLAGCTRVSVNVPIAAKDALDYLATCRDTPDATDSSIHQLSADGTEHLVAPTAPRVLLAGPITPTPDGSAFVAGYGGGVCGTLLWIDATGSRLLPWTITDQGATYRLDVEPDLGGGDCSETGRTDQPTFSADGSTLAFFGSPESVGKTGHARTEARWTIYLADPTIGTSRPLLTGVRSPRGLRYSHDGTRLAFSGGLIDGRTGSWCVDVTTGVVKLVSPDEFDSLDWSPMDDRIVGVVNAEQPGDLLLANVIIVEVP
jgi:hypothetical protein